MDAPEMSTPGMFVNIIPKDGGNQYHGSVFGEYTRAGFNGDNVNSTLKKAGLQAPQTLERYAFNPSIGGPIQKDRLWFQGSFLVFQNTNKVLNSYANASTNPLVFTPDLSHPVNDPVRNYAGTGRVTWQASAKNKKRARHPGWRHRHLLTGQNDDSPTDDQFDRTLRPDAVAYAGADAACEHLAASTNLWPDRCDQLERFFATHRFGL
jgi:hypothetical protein